MEVEGDGRDTRRPVAAAAVVAAAPFLAAVQRLTQEHRVVPERPARLAGRLARGISFACVVWVQGFDVKKIRIENKTNENGNPLGVSSKTHPRRELS